MFRGFLKQSTAATVNIGPHRQTDGTSDFTTAIAQADVQLSKNAGAYAQKGDATSTSHKYKGVHGCPLSTADTGTLGILEATAKPTGSLGSSDWWIVVTTPMYNWLMGTDYQEVDVVQYGGATPPTVQDIVDAIGEDDVSARTTANSLGKAINALTALAARTNNANLHALMGLADTAGVTLVDALVALSQLALRNDSYIVTDRSTYLAAINADEGSGAGTYSPVSHSNKQLAANQLLVYADTQIIVGTGVNVTGTDAGAITAASFAANSITASALATDAVNEIAAAVGGGGSDEILSTTISDATVQTALVLTDGSPDDDAYDDMVAIITDQATAYQVAVVRTARSSSWDKDTKTLTLLSAPGFTVAAGDSIVIKADDSTAVLSPTSDSTPVRTWVLPLRKAEADVKARPLVKQPGETVWYGMDFANLLGAASGGLKATIASISNTSDGGNGVIASSTFLGTVVRLQLTGGTDGDNLTIQVTIVDTNGNIHVGDGALYIED